MKIINIKSAIASVVAASMLIGCAGNSPGQASGPNSSVLIGSAIGALAGIALGNNIGGRSKGRNKVIGAAAGAAIGGAIGYSISKQAKEVAGSLNTDVNNDPNAALDPSNDLIVSNTDRYVKIMFRDKMMFTTNSSVPTLSAQSKTAKVGAILNKYPKTIVQVVGYTDSRGTYAYNKTLSEKRASNVGNTILNSGIGNQVFSKGCSYDKPVAPNTSAANMALNRRVEIYLYPKAEYIVDVCR
ncbi:MAG: hypothetical protein CR967_03920 [Proteobacteria bacterium]|nr:MAG: hypothetical protein CR967_03920 [Pseudomonadota bacterium]